MDGARTRYKDMHGIKNSEGANSLQFILDYNAHIMLYEFQPSWQPELRPEKLSPCHMMVHIRTVQTGGSAPQMVSKPACNLLYSYHFTMHAHCEGEQKPVSILSHQDQ